MSKSKTGINTSEERTGEARAGTSEEGEEVRSSSSAKTFVYLGNGLCFDTLPNENIPTSDMNKTHFVTMTKHLNWLFLTEWTFSTFTVVSKTTKEEYLLRLESMTKIIQYIWAWLSQWLEIILISSEIIFGNQASIYL